MKAELIDILEEIDWAIRYSHEEKVKKVLKKAKETIIETRRQLHYFEMDDYHGS